MAGQGHLPQVYRKYAHQAEKIYLPLPLIFQYFLGTCLLRMILYTEGLDVRPIRPEHNHGASRAGLICPLWFLRKPLDSGLPLCH